MFVTDAEFPNKNKVFQPKLLATKNIREQRPHCGLKAKAHVWWTGGAWALVLLGLTQHLYGDHCSHTQFSTNQIGKVKCTKH